MLLIVDPTGQIRCLYDEAVDLASLGTLAIRRASHVEPDQHGNWWSDLTPVGGPQLGPYIRRTLALHAERCWLEQPWLASPMDSDTPAGSMSVGSAANGQSS